jgi:hypothetical protein
MFDRIRIPHTKEQGLVVLRCLREDDTYTWGATSEAIKDRAIAVGLTSVALAPLMAHL